MKWYQALFLPLRTARMVNRQCDDIARLEQEVSQLQKECDSMRCTVMTHREKVLMQGRELQQLADTLADRDKRLAEMQGEVEHARAELGEYTQLMQLIESFEETKSDYERRLATLREQLKDARDALRLAMRPELDDAPAPVDMTRSRPAPVSDLDQPSPSAAEVAEGGDWLEQLPENL